MSRAQIAALIAAVLGLGPATYLTIEHFSSSPSFLCPENSAINCLKVTTSEWSRVAGMPVAVLGLVFFAVMAVLCLPWLWRVRWLDGVRVAGGVAGIISVLYLVWAELFRIRAICLWCTVVHVLTVVLFGAILWAVSERPTNEVTRPVTGRDESAVR